MQFAENRIACSFRQQKINIYKDGKEIEPKAQLSAPGTLKLCLISRLDPQDVIERHWKNIGLIFLRGPITRNRAPGPITLFYLRDTDLNLIEISHTALLNAAFFFSHDPSAGPVKRSMR